MSIVTQSLSYDRNNVFAKILRNELRANIVYKDNKILAFHDINPIASTHILVIPNGEYIDYCDFLSKASSDDICHYFSTINSMVKQFKLDQSGFKLVTHNGKGGGQEIPHFHTHIISNQKIESN